MQYIHNFFFLLMLCILFSFTSLGDEAHNSEYEMAVIEELNNVRTEYLLDSLVIDESLNCAAEVRAEEISVCWSHTRPDGLPWYSVNPDIMYGENLAHNYLEPTMVVDGWMHSPSHREIMLSKNYKTIGIKVFYKNNVPYVAAEFGY